MAYRKGYVEKPNTHYLFVAKEMPPIDINLTSKKLSTSTWEQETNMIPIIVNGQINATKEDSKTNDAINKLDHIHKLVTESTVEVTKSRTKYS
jgi:hypothetical protein